GVREPMYTTAVGLIQYAYMHEAYFGATSDAPPASLVEASATTHTHSNRQPERKHANKPGLFNRAKKVFDNFFE
ncbi:hypothetical protein J4G37_35685, partial [Microvirga sp. 3-52]|nr:hypothetical protein [Microvirga sp. 3-52]